MTRDSNNNVRPNLYRVGSSFRRGADNLRATFSSDAIVQIQRVRRVPRWVRLMHKINNHYGLKHVCLIGCLIGYQLLGAMVFYFCEHSNEQKVNDEWRHDLERNRTLLVHKIINSLFNNTEYLFFLSNDQTTNVQIRLESDLMSYEKQLGIRSTPKKQNWDYWTAALYAQMISTTIGGGFVGLQVDTSMGRLFTMLYVCGGVPLMLAVLDDLGKLLTLLLRTVWWKFTCTCRRAFRYCTKQSLAEIEILDVEDKRNIEMFDLPVAVALIVTFLWVILFAAMFCFFEDSSFFMSFYMVFLSLTTIGLEVNSTAQPKYFLLLSVFLVVGLALVSCCVNLIQGKLERAYKIGQVDLHSVVNSKTNDIIEASKPHRFHVLRRQRSSLGLLKGISSWSVLPREAFQRHLAERSTYNKSSQTLLSFPSPSRNSVITKSVYQSRLKSYPRTISIDEIMNLVDTEDGDIVLLGALTRDESAELSEAIQSEMSCDSSTVNKLVVSKSFELAFSPSEIQELEPSYLPMLTSSSKSLTKSRLSNCPSTIPVPNSIDLESLEEMEDQLLLTRAASYDANPSVHFRSRLSLIAEQHSVIDESEENTIISSATDQTPSLSSNAKESNENLCADEAKPKVAKYSRKKGDRQVQRNSTATTSLLPRLKNQTNGHRSIC